MRPSSTRRPVHLGRPTREAAQANRDTTSPATGTEVLVVGGGPTGLACAAALARRGVPTVVFEQGEDVGAAWADRYRCLRLNSGRAFSTLPGLRFPRGTPMFPPREAVVRYLQDYRAEHGLQVQTRTCVTRIDHCGGQWQVATNQGVRTAAHVVLATGLLAKAKLPEALATGGSSPPVIHSLHYVDAVPYRGREVLVVGAGTSALEIAHDLVVGGARSVLLSVRTPPNILPRSVLGLPGDPGVLLLMRVPPRVADAQVRLLSRLTIGDLRDCGLAAPAEGPFTLQRRGVGAGPAIIDRAVVDDLRAGRIKVVGAVTGVQADQVRLIDGRAVSVDAVIAATGFRSGLEPLVGHLGVLDAGGLPIAADARPALPGLWFVNFRMRPGLLGAARGRARRSATAIAKAIKREGTIPNTTTHNRTPGRSTVTSIHDRRLPPLPSS